MLLDPYPDFVPSEYRVKWATDAWEVREAYALRRAVFCTEQAVYASDDRDATDDDAQLLVATACMCGVAQQVVGT
ncbi:MAG: histone acetyltransferase, partial [Gammaproteobacteria bacterium]|nr:histone acetyltransferase [Gammaproteobacteria bacterium]